MAKEPKPDSEAQPEEAGQPGAEQPKAEQPKAEQPKAKESKPKDAKPKEGKEPKEAKAKEGKKDGGGGKEGGGKEKGKGKKGEPAEPAVPAPTPRLQIKYQKEVLPALAGKIGRKNPHALPRLEKIVVNMGVGAATQEKKFLETAAEAMGQITGQKPIITKARQAISAFKLREGMPIGCKVTLRGRKMYEFMDRLISLALPRVRDFRGISRKAFDGNGSYSLGLGEQLVFPELNPDKFTRVQGMNITFVVRNATDDESRELLTQMGMPFQTEEPTKKKK
jgi:large subunit ribosomal protein L5